EVHAHRAREAARVAVLVAVLEVHARAVGQARLHPGDERATALVQCAPLALAIVVVRVGEVVLRLLGLLEPGAELHRRPELAARHFAVHDEAVVQPERASDAAARVALAVARLLHRTLTERVGAPAALRVEADLADHVGALALLLGERHGADPPDDRRIVLAV